MLKLIFVIILTWVSFVVAANAAPIGRFTDNQGAGEFCAVNFAQLGRAVQTTVTNEDRARLAIEIAQAIQTLKSLETSASEIKAVTKTHRTGAYTSGAFEVETSRGPKFLKIYASTPVEQSAYTHVVQNALARKGFAPTVSGYLSPSEVRRLISRIPSLQSELGDDPTTFAVIMDRVEPVVSIGRGVEGKMPIEWTKERLRERVVEFEKAMSELRIIPPMDLQASIDKSGRFLLYDFDGYGYVTEDLKVFAYESPAGRMSHATFTRSYYGEDISWAAGTPMDRFRLDSNGIFRVELSKLRKYLGLQP